MAAIWIKYNTGATLYFPLVGSATAAFSTAASGSLIGTNIYISKDGGALATSTNTGTHIGSGIYQLVLTASEASATQGVVLIGKGTLGTIVEHQMILYHTYGHASAYYQFDLSAPIASANVVQVLGTAASGSGGIQGVNIVQVLATAASGSGGILGVNVVQALATAVSASAGIFGVNKVQLLGTAVVGTQGIQAVNSTRVAGTDVNAAGGTLIVNLVPNQATATVGTVLVVAGSVNLRPDQSTATIGTLLTLLGTPAVNVTQINASGTAAILLGQWANTVASATATGTKDTVSLQIDQTATAANYWKGRTVVFITGALAKQAAGIVSSTGSSVGTLGRLIVTTLSTAPADSDQILIIGGPSDANLTYWLGTAAAGSAGTPLVNLVANQATATIGTVTFLAGSVNLIPNQATATVGTALVVLGTPVVNITQILGTAIVGTQGTLTNIGTAGLVLAGTIGTVTGTINADVVRFLGTAATGTQGIVQVDVQRVKGTLAASAGGTLLANLVADQSIVTIGTLVFMSGSVDLRPNQATATVGTISVVLGSVNLRPDQSTATIGTVLAVLGTPVVNVTQILGTGVVGTQGTFTNVGTVGLASTVNIVLGSVDLRANQSTSTIGLVSTVTVVLGGTIGTVTGTVNADIVRIGGTAAAASNLRDAALGILRGTAITGTLTTTVMTTDATETSDNHYKGRILIFLGGTLDVEATDVTAYDGTGKAFTFSTLTDIPASGQLWVLV